MSSHYCDQNTHRCRGQGLVEFALVLPILMLLLLGILQFAMILGTQVGLTNAAREAARIASVVRTDSVARAGVQGPGVRNALTSILPTTIQAYQAANLDAAATRVCYQQFTDAAGKIAIRVRVDVAYRHPLFIPLIAPILGGTGNTLTVTASQEFPVENPPIVSSDLSTTGNCY